MKVCRATLLKRILPDVQSCAEGSGQSGGALRKISYVCSPMAILGWQQQGMGDVLSGIIGAMLAQGMDCRRCQPLYGNLYS